MKKITKTFPKKAKLITDGGFYKIIDIEKYISQVNIPLSKRITLSTPETNMVDMTLNFTCQFVFKRVYRGYAEYRQINVINVVK